MNLSRYGTCLYSPGEFRVEWERNCERSGSGVGGRLPNGQSSRWAGVKGARQRITRAEFHDSESGPAAGDVADRLRPPRPSFAPSTGSRSASATPAPSAADRRLPDALDLPARLVPPRAGLGPAVDAELEARRAGVEHEHAAVGDNP